MNIAVFGKTPESKAQLKKALKTAGHTYDEKKPDLVISYGGDGTFLRAERKYPGTPKALFRYSQICNKCHNLPINHALELLKKRKFKTKTHPKLEVLAGNNKLLAINDIVIRNAAPTHAIRWKLHINNKQINDVFIGDGIVIATPFGSTGYFNSITRKKFSKGIGIAFNNTTKQQKPLYISEKATIKFTLLRGNAFIVADNNPKMLLLTQGKHVTIQTSKKKARLVSF